MINSKLNPLKKNIASKKLEDMGLKEEYFETGVESKNNQATYFQRMPLCFKDCQTKNKKIYFSNFFYWMGKIRDSATFPILKQILDDFLVNKLALITKSSSLKIVGDAKLGDIIETHLWIGKNSKTSDDVYDIFFKWKKVLLDGSYEDIAYGNMCISWVKLISDKEIKALSAPLYFKKFMQTMESLSTNSKEENIQILEKGKELYLAPIAPIRGKLLYQIEIEATVEDSDAIGNIYFANYSSWQGKVRDQFFQNMEKKYKFLEKDDDSLIVLDNSLIYLREAKPFDTILITMNVVGIWEYIIELTFTYYKLENNKKIKLAKASQILKHNLSEEYVNLLLLSIK